MICIRPKQTIDASWSKMFGILHQRARIFRCPPRMPTGVRPEPTIYSKMVYNTFFIPNFTVLSRCLINCSLSKSKFDEGE